MSQQLGSLPVRFRGKRTGCRIPSNSAELHIDPQAEHTRPAPKSASAFRRLHTRRAPAAARLAGAPTVNRGPGTGQDIAACFSLLEH
jgi:hypothetical protein